MLDTLRGLRDFFWPDTCAGCRQSSDRPLCRTCSATLLECGPLCGRCGSRLPIARPRCPRCLPAADGGVDAIVALGPYVRPSPLADAVLQLKYGGRRQVARELGHLLASRCQVPGDAIVVPVPLHTSRLRSRGYNQAALLAAIVARERGRPLGVRALGRHRATDVQASLASAAARRRNTLAAFVVRTPSRIVGRTVVLIDDIVTTGATLDACARAVRRAGATRVLAYAVGRTP